METCHKSGEHGETHYSGFKDVMIPFLNKE